MRVAASGASSAAATMASSSSNPFELPPLVFVILVVAALLARTYLRTAEELTPQAAALLASSSNAGTTARRRTGDADADEKIGFLVSVHPRMRHVLDDGSSYQDSGIATASYSDGGGERYFDRSDDNGADSARAAPPELALPHGGCSFDSGCLPISEGAPLSARSISGTSTPFRWPPTYIAHEQQRQQQERQRQQSGES